MFKKVNFLVTEFYFISQLIKRLLLLLACYILFRLLFYFYNASLFIEKDNIQLVKALVIGIRFDLSAIILSNGPFILLHLLPLNWRFSVVYQRILQTLFFLVNLPLIILMAGDIAYFPFSLKHISADIFEYSDDVIRLMPSYLFDYWYMIVVLIIFSYFLWKLYRQTIKSTVVKQNIWIQCCIILFSIPVFVVLARGGTQARPVGAIDTVGDVAPDYSKMVTNAAFNVFVTLGNPGLEEKKYFTDQQAERLFSIYRLPSDTALNYIVPLHKSGRKNVMVIILESFSKEYMGVYGAQQSATPFLDSLSQYSLVFDNMFANAFKSVEGIPAICASIPSLSNTPFVFSKYQTNSIDGLGSLVSKIGYSTAFFHGGVNGSFHFDSFSKLAGFKKYFGKNEYDDNKDYDGNWGIYDEPFFKFTADKVNELDTPFCSVLFSLSSHHPYSIPSHRKSAVEKYQNKILSSVRYTDLSLSEFFKKASSMPWFKNTLFIITADHNGPTLQKYDLDPDDFFSIPLIVYNPSGDESWHMHSDMFVQQIDILPGIMDFLGSKFPYNSFGRSIFRKHNEQFVLNFYTDRYFVITTDRILQWANDSVLSYYAREKGQLRYIGDFPADEKIKFNAIQDTLKAYIQVYNNAMIKNKISGR